MRIAARFQPYLIAAAACLGLAAFAGFDLMRDRDRSVDLAKASTANLALLLEEHTRQTLLRVDAVLTDAVAAIDSLDSGTAAAGAVSSEALAATLAGLPRDGLVRSVAWLTGQGDLAGLAVVPGTTAPDQQHAAAWHALASKSTAGQRAIGALQQDSAGVWVLPMVLRLPQAAVIAWVDLRGLQRVLDAVDRGSDGFITLFNADAWMLATSPRNDSLMTKNWSSAPMFTEHLQRSRAASVRQVVMRDGTERVYSYRALADFPVIVSIGLSMTDVLAAWRTRALWDFALWVSFCAALMTAATLLSRTLTRRESAERALATSARQTESRELFLRTLTDSVPLRIAHVDSNLRFSFVNRAHCERFQLPREAILGRTREEITGQPASTAIAEHVQAVLRGEPRRFEYEESHAEGTRVIEAYLVPDRTDNGEVIGFYAAGADVTARHAQQRRLEAALAERETLLREVYHRVKNNLQVVQSLLNLQRRALPEGPARTALEESVRRVHAMALVHERLYQEGDLSAVQLKDYTEQLLRDLADGAGAEARGIDLVADVEAIEASLTSSVPYGLLVTELVSNSLKHAFRDGRRGLVRVQLRQTQNRARLQVTDNGTGLPAGFSLEHTTSMGLQLAAGLATQLGGVLQASSPADGGSAFDADLSLLG